MSSLALEVEVVKGQDDHRKYKHALLPSKEHIRILILLPGSGKDELSCDLEASDLNQVKNNYVALSYVWGDPGNTTDILCHGKMARITFNLAEALQALRDSVTPKRLWADAICIDQTNNKEKNQQVKRMGTIYNLAKQVVVWLGHDTDEIAKDCFDLITDTNGYLDEQLVKYGNMLDVPTFVKPYPICDNWSRWDKVRKMLALRWFKRVWVIQEAGLAKACSLQWGHHELDFAQIVELALWQVSREDLAEITGPLKVLRLTDLFRDVHCSYRNPETWRTNLPLVQAEVEMCPSQLFLDVLLAASGMLATDKRDHVFAFLGSPLAFQSDGKLLVEPDYNKELRDVFYEAACSILRHPREAPYLLSRVKHSSVESLEDPKIPSWVPRWDKTVEFTISRPQFWYCAGGVGDFRPDIQRDRALAVQGIVFECLVFTSRSIQKHNVGKNPHEWDEEYRVAQKPFIDVLWEETLRAAKSANAQFENEFALTLVRAYPATPGKICDTQHMTEFAAYRYLVRCAAKCEGYHESDQQCAPGQAAFPRNFLHRLNYCADLRVAVLESGRLGLVPYAAQPGDYCCILRGVPVPIILRLRTNNIFKLVGESYIHGVMAGEVMEYLAEGKVKEETLTVA